MLDLPRDILITLLIELDIIKICQINTQLKNIFGTVKLVVIIPYTLQEFIGIYFYPPHQHSYTYTYGARIEARQYYL